MKLLLSLLANILLPAYLVAAYTPPCTYQFDTDIDSQGDTVCLGVSVAFNNTSNLSGNITSTKWNFGDGTQLIFTEDANHAFIQAGNYTVKFYISSANCTLDSVTKVIHVIDQPNFLSWGTDATCSGDCDGTGNIDIQISPPVTYHYMWDDPGMQTTATATGLCAGVYSATISDDYGCTVVASGITVNEPDPIVVFAGADISICPGSQWPVSDATIVSGGVGPFTYNWSPGTSAGMSPDNILNPILTVGANSFTTFTLKVTDSNGCKGSDSLEVTKTLAKIAGTVYEDYAETIPLHEGVAYLIEVGPSDMQWIYLDTVTLVNGDYVFDSVPLTNVMVLAKQTMAPLTVMPTYWGDTLSWETADTIHVACGTMYFNTNIHCIAMSPGSGTCDFHGTVFLVSNGKTQTEDPIPFIDVVVKKTPPGNGIAYTQTNTIDTTFTFYNIVASPDTYSFIVNVPGLGMQTNYSIVVSSNDSLWDNLNFYVDTTTGTGGIFTYNPLGINPVKFAEKQMTVSPNPFNDRVEMKFPNKEKGKFSIRLFDVTGKVIIDMDDLDGNSYLLKTDMLEQGIYIAEIRTENDTFRERVMKK